MARRKVNYLDLIPRHSEKLSYKLNENGQVTILIENKGIFNILMQKAAKKPRVTEVDLLGEGSFVWLCIDGKRTVYDIAAALRKEYGEEAEPIYNRLVTYLRTLEGCGLVEMERKK